jgi:hypothetical protein
MAQFWPLTFWKETKLIANMGAKHSVGSRTRVLSGAGAALPLDASDILLRALNILGPGQHLFISAVSKAWRESYKGVASVQMAGVLQDCGEEAELHTITPEMTLHSAVFASAGRVHLAYESGLTFGYQHSQRIAGKVADIPVLEAAQQLGLALTHAVLIGAAESGSTIKLQWLHVRFGSRLPEDACNYAARSGSINMLKWLKQHGCVYDNASCRAAAAGAHTHVLQHLRDEGCEWDCWTCAAAAVHGHLSTLQWLYEQGCPWSADRICGAAAYSGSIEMLHYLKQQGCVFNAWTMRSAAVQGLLPVCQYLLAEGCPCDAQGCAAAAAKGYLETVRFLHESGCLWDASTICSRAARSGSIELLQYLKQQGCDFNEAVMSSAAEKGHTHMCQYLRAEQCPWDSRACEAAAKFGQLDTLRWLHEQGCPWTMHMVRLAALSSGHVTVMVYMLGVQPAANAAQLTELLNSAGELDDLPAAQMLRE